MRYSIRSLLWLTALVAICCSAQPALPVIPVVYHCVVVFAALFTFIAGANGRNRITAGIFGGAVGGTIGTILFLALMPPKHWLLGVVREAWVTRDPQQYRCSDVEKDQYWMRYILFCRFGIGHEPARD